MTKQDFLKKIEIKKVEHSIDLLKEIASIALIKDNFKELGYAIFSDKDHTWYLLYLNNKLIGFCSAIIKPKNISFGHDFILKTYRGHNLYNELFKARFMDNKAKFIKAVATKKSLNTFLRFGFQIDKQTTNYTFLSYGKD